MAANEHEWAVVRLVTIQKKGEMGRLLFTTVTELTRDRPIPTRMTGVDRLILKGGQESLYFRRTILSRVDAKQWYMSLGEGERRTPLPTRKEDRESRLDDVPIQTPRLEDDQPWPALGLPIREELFSRPGLISIDPAPFIGSVPSRLHRRFGDRSGLEGFLQDTDAHAFVARRMHINLFNYKEYLGSTVFISPDPVIRQIDHFMVPANDEHGERIIYHIVSHPGQNLEGVRVTAFDKEARLLTSFETYQMPANGILEVDKGTCMGEYGFVVTHDKYGVLAYQPSSPFLRQLNLEIRAHSGSGRKVRVPVSDAQDAPLMEYQASMGSGVASKSIIGDVKNPGASVRVNEEAMKREKTVYANHYGQRWLPEGSREEAANFIQDLLRSARSKVMIADPYLSALQLGQFLYVLHGDEVELTLLTTKLAFKSNPPATKLDLLKDFKHRLGELNRHQRLVPDVRVISANSLHDRFLVVDSDVWFIGNSLNSLGEKASMIVRLPDPDQVINRLQELSSKSLTLDDYIGKVSKISMEWTEE